MIESKQAEVAEIDAVRMPLLSHLKDLRLRLRNSALCFLGAFVLCYFFKVQIFFWLAEPLLRVFVKAKQSGFSGQLVMTELHETYWVFLRTALISALFVASPFIFYQLWRFISPGLYPKEKRWAIPFVSFAAFLFLGGGLFCYFFVLPAGYDFFLSVDREGSLYLQKEIFQRYGLEMNEILKPMITISEYFGLTLLLLVGFGVVFELPLLLCFLSLIGIVSANRLWKWNRYAILIFAILGAILTPGDLVVGQLLMTGALTILYNLSIVLVWLVQKTRKVN